MPSPTKDTQCGILLYLNSYVRIQKRQTFQACGIVPLRNLDVANIRIKSIPTKYCVKNFTHHEKVLHFFAKLRNIAYFCRSLNEIKPENK